METPTGATPSGASGYEFTTAQNQVIRATGSRTRIWGILSLIGGGLTALIGLGALFTGEAFGVVAGIVYGLLSLIPIFVGLNFLKAGRALGTVVTTEGDDIDHLMSAMVSLSRAFLIQIVATAVWGGLVLVGIIAAIAIPTLAG